MENLLELIADLRNREAPAAELFNAFTDRMRERFGACAMALVCTEGMDEHRYRVLSFTDEQGARVIDDLELSTPPDPANAGWLENRAAILDPTQAVIQRGPISGFDALFQGSLSPYNGAVSLPLVQHDGVHRWLLLLFTEPGQVDRVDVERGLELATLAINYVFSVENARRLAAANAWIERELESVARIQKLLLPQALEDTPGIRVARYFQPYAYVGGDYYEIVPLGATLWPDFQTGDAETWGLLVADASGHGAAAAVEIAMFDAVLRTYHPSAEEFTGPGDVLTYVNRYFFTRMLRGSFITAFVSNYDPQAGLLNYANAGHPRPILRRNGEDQLLLLESGAGFPLGVDKTAAWESSSVEMGGGDLLVMFTDGISEARSASGEAFGIERLRQAIREAPNDAEGCLAAIRQSLRAHCGNAAVGDDQTLLVVEVLD